MSLQTFDERLIFTGGKVMLPADGVAVTGIIVSQAFDRRIDSLFVCNRDTIGHVVNILLTTGGITFQIGSLTVPAGSGYLGTPPIDVIAVALPAMPGGLLMGSNVTLSAQMVVAIQATFDVSFFASGGIF